MPSFTYEAVAVLPVGQVPARGDLQLQLTQGNWRNGRILWYPGDNPTSWPADLPKPASDPTLSTTVATVGQWAGNLTMLDPATMFAKQVGGLAVISP